MDEKFRKKERRRQGQLERLGTNTPRCVVCGEGSPSCLELHHLAGRNYGDDLVTVCRNCHRKLSDAQKDHPNPKEEEPSFENRLAHFLHGLADLFKLLEEQLRAFANRLFDEMSGRKGDQGRQA